MSDDEPDDGNRCHNDRCRRVLTDGWTLCHKCSGHLADDLLEIADRFHRLTTAPAMEPGRYDRGGGGKPGSKPPLRLDIVVLRDYRSGQTQPVDWTARDGKVHEENPKDPPSVLRAVYGWAETVMTEREFEHDPPFNVDGAVAYLNQNAEWIAKWDAGGALVENVRLLRNRLRSATGDANDRPIGKCFKQEPVPGGAPRVCNAPVFPPDAGDGTPARCIGNPRHEFDARGLVTLQMDMEEAERKAKERRDGHGEEKAS